MKKIYILLGSLLFITACSTDLEQAPPNLASADSLTDFEGVLNAAYFYQLGAVTPMAVMGEFRSDNAFMFEAPYTEFDVFTNNFIIIYLVLIIHCFMLALTIRTLRGSHLLMTLFYFVPFHELFNVLLIMLKVIKQSFL